MNAAFLHDKFTKHGLNTKGRDWAIGDVHGRFDLVEGAMRQINFNSQVDRLFCVGDLIDRGGDSYIVAEFLNTPGIFAVRGNHEDNLLSLYTGGFGLQNLKNKAYIEQFGLQWWLEIPQRLQEKILIHLSKLPLAMQVNTVHGEAGFVHADISTDLSWEQFLGKVEAGDEEVIKKAMWGRERLEHLVSSNVFGLNRLYVGHTVQDNITMLSNVVAIDTGAVYNRFLTVVDMSCTVEDIRNSSWMRITEGVQVIKSSNYHR